MMERQRPRGYIPPLRFHVLTRYYDRLIAATLRERAIKGRLVAEVAPQPGERILDLGAGTGTLTMMLKRAAPDAAIVALDADEQALTRARGKAAQAGLAIDFVTGRAEASVLPAGSFDRVVSSLFFHHLSTDGKREVLASSRALLRGGGTLHILDWGKPHGWLMRAAYLSIQLLDGFATTRDNVHGRLPDLIREAGFSHVDETHRTRTVFGTLSIYRAVAP